MADESIDRRALLKKSAMAAGVVAWVAPAVVAMTPGTAAANQSSLATNCFPRPTFQAIPLESNCKSKSFPQHQYDPDCCQGFSYVIDLATGGGDCGPTCGGGLVGGTDGVIVSCAPGATDCQVRCPGNPVVSGTNCANGSTMTVNVKVRFTCDDGSDFTCEYVVAFNIGLDCNALAPGTILSGGCVPTPP